MSFSDLGIGINLKEAIPVLVVVCTMLTGCSKSPDEPENSEPVPNVVTADIQAGIENYIEDQVLAGGGYFKLTHGDVELCLKLVRVHTEYLANLGPRTHFACVDLANIDGNVYDVDFFLAGDPGSMTVTETTVHKINGQPYYSWGRKKGGGWRRIPVEESSKAHLGVIKGRDEFEFIYRVTLPEIIEPARMWIPLAATDAYQTVETTSIKTPGQQEILKDSEYGNNVLFLELSSANSGQVIEIIYHVQRSEKSVYPQETVDPERFLRPERLVPDTEDFHSIAKKVIEGKDSDLARARALYDHVIDRMRYMKYGSGWGKGDAVYACSVLTGNCTDFHSYFIALCRAVGIPARFAIGAAIPSERDSGGIDGYHCWAEFYAEEKWWPVDISEGDKYSALSTYYFGHHPANRVELSRGRDLIVDPAPTSGSINFLAYPVFEIGRKPEKARVEFFFNRTISGRQ